MTSNSDATHQPTVYDGSTLESSGYLNNGSQRPKYDSNALLMLPAPLSVNRPMMSSASTVAGRTSDDNYLSDSASYSNQRLIQDQYSDSHESMSPAMPPMLSPPTPYEPPIPRTRNTVSSPQQHPEGNPFRSVPTSPTYENETWSPDSSDETVGSGSRHGASSNTNGASRGIRLTDVGPITGPDGGVRRVARNSRPRPPSVGPQQNRYSRNSGTFSLPPGAAPPQPYQYGGA